MDEPPRTRYSADHAWFRSEGDGQVTVGVAERISRILTLVELVEAAPAGSRLAAGDRLFTIESQKAEIEVAAPAPLEVTHVNEELARDPMLVRMDPRGRGWVLRARMADADFARLLDELDYRALPTD
jgi:glycine cleavage system H protein